MNPLIATENLPLLIPGRHLLEGRTVGLNHLTLVLGENEPGQGVPLHSREFEEVFIIHADRGTRTVRETTVEAGPGDVVVIPANVRHRFANHTREPLYHTPIHSVGRFTSQTPE